MFRDSKFNNYRHIQFIVFIKIFYIEFPELYIIHIFINLRYKKITNFIKKNTQKSKKKS